MSEPQQQEQQNQQQDQQQDNPESLPEIKQNSRPQSRQATPQKHRQSQQQQQDDFQRNENQTTIQKSQNSVPVQNNHRQTPQQKANYNNRYGDRNGGLRPIDRKRANSTYQTYSTTSTIDMLQDFMKSLNQDTSQRGVGIGQVSQSLLRETESLKIKQKYAKQKYKNPYQNSMLNQISVTYEEEDPEDPEVILRKEQEEKQKQNKINRLKLEEDKIKQEIQLMQIWQKRLKANRILNKEIDRELGKKKNQYQTQNSPDKDNQQLALSAIQSERSISTERQKLSFKNEEKFKCIENPYVSYQLTMLEKEKIDREIKKKQKKKRSQSQNNVKSRRGMQDLWKQQQDQAFKEPKELPHYMVLTAKGKYQKEELERKKLEMEKQAKPKIYKRIKMEDIWKNNEEGQNKEPEELPHYMSNTTSIVNYKNKLLEEIEERKPKSPKKWTKKKKNMADLYREQNENQDQEPKELPSYMKQTKAYQNNLEQVRQQKQLDDDRKKKEEDLRKKKLKKSNMQELWEQQEQEKQEGPKKRPKKERKPLYTKYEPHKNADKAKAILKKYPSQPKIWIQLLQNISLQQSKENRNNQQASEYLKKGQIDLAGYHIEKYHAEMEAYFYNQNIIVDVIKKYLSLGSEQFRVDKQFLAESNILLALKVFKEKLKPEEKQNHIKKFIEGQRMVGSMDASRFGAAPDNKKDDKLRKKAQEYFKNNCEVLQKNYNKDSQENQVLDKEFVTGVLKDQISASIQLMDLQFVQYQAKIALELTQDEATFKKYSS